MKLGVLHRRVHHFGQYLELTVVRSLLIPFGQSDDETRNWDQMYVLRIVLEAEPRPRKWSARLYASRLKRPNRRR
jgi:hypothetical protein